MAAMSDKVLAEIQARAAMGRALMADIEVSLNEHGKCHNWVPYMSGGQKCSLVRHIPNQKIKICSDCPLWKTTDATYEEIYQTHVLQTYEWWRSEWERTGQTYARDRMVDFIKTWEPELEPEPVVSTRVRTELVWHGRSPLQVLLLGAFLGLVLGIVVQTVVVAWIF